MSLTKNLVFASMTLFATTAYGSTTYKITAIDGISGLSGTTIANSINNNGQVVGTHGGKASVWTKNAGGVDLGQLPGRTFMNARDINDSGSVVGNGTSLFSSTNDAFLYSGSMTNIGDLPGGATSAGASAINNSHQIVGTSQSANGQEAFLYMSGNMQGLGGLDANNIFSSANDINNSGIVVGQSASPTASRAFRWDNSNGMTDLGDLAGGSDRSYANAINDSGMIVGASVAASGWRGVVWDNGNMIDIGDLAGGNDYSVASDVNNLGMVVGNSQDASASGQSAFIWDSTNGMQSLDSLLDVSSAGWHLEFAYGINDSGMIVGSGYYNGQVQAFLAEPVPEPAIMSLFGLGAVIALRRKRKIRNN